MPGCKNPEVGPSCKIDEFVVNIMCSSWEHVYKNTSVSPNSSVSPPSPVARSKCPSYVGREGIVLQETQNTLKMICRDSKIRSESTYHVLSLTACLCACCVQLLKMTVHPWLSKHLYLQRIEALQNHLHMYVCMYGAQK